jgi:formate hydrogenlyase subunit 3/multisubunit Na+/H+ antiporter MnhD subunit
VSPTLAGLLLLSGPLLPVACAALQAFPRARGAAGALTPWSAFPTLVAAVVLPVGTSVRFDAVLLGVELGLDTTGQVFLVFTSLLWWLSGLYARAYLRGDPREAPFWFFFALALGGNLGLIVAQDLVGFYSCFALMSLASYGLVVHGRSEASLRAGRVYLVFAVGGELALFTGIVGLAAAAGSLDFDQIARVHPPGWALASAAAGLGVKAGALGLHLWLPLAHPAAPVPASAVLSGAMIKAGLLGWLRILPLGRPGLEGWGWMLFGVGVAAAFYAAAVGVTQRDPKAVLAYSSVSQMGLMTAGLGFGLAFPAWGRAALVAVLLYAIHHALAKAALFLGVGVASRVGAPFRGATVLGLALPALSLAGAPLTSGALAKALLKTPIAEAGDAGPGLVLLLSLAAVGTTLLMIRFLALLPRTASPGSEGPLGLLLPWAALLAFGPVLAFAPWPAVGTTSLDLLTPPKLAVAFLPLIAGAALYALGRRVGARWPGLRVEVPPGDLLALVRWPPPTSPRAEGVAAGGGAGPGPGAAWTRHLDGLERVLGAWPVAGALWVGLVLALLLVAALV